MARFDVYRPTKRHPLIAYFLDVQAAILARDLETRVVVPLVPRAKLHAPTNRLHPTFEIDGETFVAIIPELAGIGVERIGAKVCSLSQHRTEIVDAIDFLMQGF